ncbi:DUF3558 family protein [Saccharopolyspora sp. NPDC000359]|uniref:DUF3558 family protein n=1 Tax=Saccharopolyspora sp. NPDC000359 TaxID=3154251 RepID=UPI003317C90F
MSTFSRSLIATTAGLALFGLSACGGGTSGGAEETTAAAPTSATSGGGLADFDPCTFFKPDELQSWGLSTQAEEFTQVSFQPGCAWEGEKMDLALQKNADETVQSIQESGSYDKFEPITVGGREAGRMIVSGATDQGGCVTVVNTGGGIVLYQITGYLRDSLADPCAEAEKIADQTASRLPE